MGDSVGLVGKVRLGGRPLLVGRPRLGGRLGAFRANNEVTAEKIIISLIERTMRDILKIS